jgi:hypothetical protein
VITPEEWIKNNLPLLFQYLSCNRAIFDCKYIGISAQGGNYDNDGQIDEIISKDPSERIIIKEEHVYSNDITKNIAWLAE